MNRFVLSSTALSVTLAVVTAVALGADEVPTKKPLQWVGLFNQEIVDWLENENCLDQGPRLECQYNPNEITDEKSTSYASIKVPGMSLPRYQFVAGEARRLSFKIEFFKGPVKENAQWLQSLQYPEHSGTMLESTPHIVRT